MLFRSVRSGRKHQVDRLQCGPVLQGTRRRKRRHEEHLRVEDDVKDGEHLLLRSGDDDVRRVHREGGHLERRSGAVQDDVRIQSVQQFEDVNNNIRIAFVSNFVSCSETELVSAICSFNMSDFDNAGRGHSTLLKHLLRKLLERKPEDRLNARTAKKHPWFMQARFFIDDDDQERGVPSFRRRACRLSSSSIEVSPASGNEGQDPEPALKNLNDNMEEKKSETKLDIYCDDNREVNLREFRNEFENVVIASTFNSPGRLPFNTNAIDSLYEFTGNAFPFSPPAKLHRKSLTHELERFLMMGIAQRKASEDRGPVIVPHSIDETSTLSKSPDERTRASTKKEMENMKIFVSSKATYEFEETPFMEAFSNSRPYFEKINKLRIERANSFDH